MMKDTDGDKGRRNVDGTDRDADEYEDAFDHAFYDTEQSGAVDYTGESNPFLGDEETFAAKLAARKRAAGKPGFGRYGRGRTKAKDMSARKSALNDDQDAWIKNRLLTSGVVRETSVATDFDDETD